MIDLVVDPRDPELEPLGPTLDGSKYRPVTVTVAPSRVVRLVSGGFLWDGAPVVRELMADASVVVNVPATDGTEIHVDDRGTFQYVVTVSARSGMARGERTVTFRGMLPVSLGATVQVTALDPGEPLPAPFTSVAELRASIDAEAATQISTPGTAANDALVAEVGEVQDPAVAGLIADTGSSTRAQIDTAVGARVKVTDGGSAAGLGGPDRPNVQIGGDRNGTTIQPDQIHGVILQPGGPGYNNIIGGDGSATVSTSTPNVASAVGNVGVSLIGGYDNVAGQISSKIISDHSYTEVGGSGHNAIYGGQGHIVRTAANYSMIAGGDRNETSAPFAFATGQLCKAQGNSSAVFGKSNTATGNGVGTLVVGNLNSGDGAYGAVFGQNCSIKGSYSTAQGSYAVAGRAYQHVVSAGRFTTAGDAQSMVVPGHVQSTSATAVILQTGGAGFSPLVPEAGAVTFTAMIVACDVATTDTAAWRVEGTLKRLGTANVTVVGTPTITKRDADAGAAAWVVGLSTASNPGLSLYGIGEAGKTIRWVTRLTVTSVATA